MNDQPTQPDRGQLLQMASGFRQACVLGAAAELDLFALLAERSLTVEEVAGHIAGDLRATRILLDALAAMQLLDKQDDRYTLPAELRPLLTEGTPQTVLPMVRHNMSMMRGWSQLAWVAKAGIPAPKPASIRGFDADRAAFIAAMHTVSGPIAADVVASVRPPAFKRMLDVGGASGTWTLAFLHAVPGATAVIFDLPEAIAQARTRMSASDVAERVTLAAGDFYRDELPGGVDFAWVSAIAHQHSRRHNQDLYAKVYRALEPGGWIALRDFVMEPSRTEPPDGALFAVNMLAGTATGNTFTFEEFSEDLRQAGFVEPELRVRTNDMNSIVLARRP